jgi:hypothetical protein
MSHSDIPLSHAETSAGRLDDLFRQPLALPDNEAMTARIMREVARVERRRKALLFCSGLVGTGIAAGVVLGANVLPGIWAGTVPALASFFGRVSGTLGQFIAYEPLPGNFGLWALAAASLVAMGLGAARVIRDP